MKILVAVKQVAALDEDFEIASDGRDVDPDFLIRDLNEWDDFSLEEAVKIKEASGDPVEVIAVSVGPEEVDESLRKCLAKGADRALRVWDEAVRGSDPIAIARILAAVAKRETPDLLFAGVQSSDQAFASTGIATAGLLGWPHGAVVANLRYAPGAKTAVFRRELEGGLLHEVEIQVPAVLTIQAGINTPRYASLRSIKQAAAKPIEVLGLSDLAVDAASVGEAGSLSHVRRMYIPEKGRAQLIEGSPAEQAARLDEIVTVKVPSQEFDPDTFAAAVGALIDARRPDVVLVAHSVDSFGYAAALAAARGLGFATDVFKVERIDGELVATRGGYGQKVSVELDFPGRS